MFKPSSIFRTDLSNAVLLLWILFCYLSFVFVDVILSCLFLVVLWSSAGKGLTSWLSCGVMGNLETFHKFEQLFFI